MSKEIKYRYHIITIEKPERNPLFFSSSGVEARFYGVTTDQAPIINFVTGGTEEEAIRKAKQSIDEKLEEAYPNAELKREMQRDLITQDYQYFADFLKEQGVPNDQIPAIAASLTLSASTRMPVEVANRVRITGSVITD